VHDARQVDYSNACSNERVHLKAQVWQPSPACAPSPSYLESIACANSVQYTLLQTSSRAPRSPTNAAWCPSIDRRITACVQSQPLVYRVSARSVWEVEHVWHLRCPLFSPVNMQAEINQRVEPAQRSSRRSTTTMVVYRKSSVG
jgi:hypothetical protein